GVARGRRDRGQRPRGAPGAAGQRLLRAPRRHRDRDQPERRTLPRDPDRAKARGERRCAPRGPGRPRAAPDGLMAMANRSPDPVIIECAINGVTSLEKNPHVPRKPAEIVEDAFRALDAGAAVIHAHNSEIALAGEEAARDYCAAWVPILARRPD